MIRFISLKIELRLPNCPRIFNFVCLSCFEVWKMKKNNFHIYYYSLTCLISLYIWILILMKTQGKLVEGSFWCQNVYVYTTKNYLYLDISRQIPTGVFSYASDVFLILKGNDKSSPFANLIINSIEILCPLIHLFNRHSTSLSHFLFTSSSWN